MESQLYQIESAKKYEHTRLQSKEDFYIQRIKSLILATRIIESVPPGQKKNGFDFSKVLAEVKAVISCSLLSGSEN